MKDPISSDQEKGCCAGAQGRKAGATAALARLRALSRALLRGDWQWLTQAFTMYVFVGSILIEKQTASAPWAVRKIMHGPDVASDRKEKIK